MVAVHAFLIAAIVRFRARRGRAPRRFGAGPGAFLRPAAPLAAVAVGTFVFGIVMAGKARDVEPTGPEGFAASSSLVAQVGGLSVPSDAKPLTINAIGQQCCGGSSTRAAGLATGSSPTASSWSPWTPRSSSTSPPRTSCTGGSSPALGGQVDAVPGDTADTWFRADREGVYQGQSTFFSGTSYSAMRAWVRVVSLDAYRQFVRQKRSDLAAAQGYVQQRVTQNAIPGRRP